MVSLANYVAGVVKSFRSARKLSKKGKGFNGKLWHFFAAFIFLALYDLAYEPFRKTHMFKIPAASSYPQLVIGDRIITTVVDLSELQRGDIVVFVPSQNSEAHFIKRLIGLPGDEIKFVDKKIQLNGELLEYKDAELSSQPTYKSRDYTKTKHQYQFLTEQMPNGKSYNVALSKNTGSFFGYDKTYIVPAEHYFFLGDNRDQSMDSRFQSVGMVPAENIVSRAQMVLYNSFWSRFLSWDFSELRFAKEL